MSGAIDPTRAQFDAFKALPRDTPIQMLNMIRFKPLADYPKDHPNHGKGLTGAEAYAEYGREADPHLSELGGRRVFSGIPEAVVIGPDGEAWDMIFVVEYPSSAVFMKMITNPEYQTLAVHRTAAVADSRLIRLKPDQA